MLDDMDGVAVVGMSCRFPGARNVDEFWRNLRDGVESVTFFSDQELRDSGVDPSIINDPNYVKAGYIIDDIDLFDASFFGYSPREAETIDPQQRLFLECAWEAIEDAGYTPQTYQGLIGVFGGARMSSYVNNMSSELSRAGTASGFQALIGNDKDYITTRVSYKLNLRGPSIAVQSACSTSLVAVHLACESIRNGECDMALAGGAAIFVPQKTGYLYQEGMIYSPDGYCRAFDAKAQGMVFGNGVGIVVLKRLDDALADRDCIHAIIKGSAVNNDGSLKVGYTAPSVKGQAEVIREAQAMAGFETETITYIETHGTGTELGDPVEVTALTSVFRAQTNKKGFCAIGSVKTNIGHLEVAAGVASLIKTVLALKHGQIPPSLHFKRPNPRIDFSNSPFFVNAKLSEWKVDRYPRRAGVSSFGVGGTNAHVVLEEAPALHPRDEGIKRPMHLMTLSARSENALKELARRYETFLETHPDASLADVCFTANVGRSHFPYRLAVATQSTEQLREQMTAFAGGIKSKRLVTAYVQSGTNPRVAFLFTGQGSQYVGMGQQLYYTQPTFRNALDRCAEILKSHLDRPLLSVVFEEEGNSSILNETVYTQPALFASEYALAEMWRSWGIEPSLVMGHSIGEYVAACVAGVFSLEDGLKLIAARGRLIQALPREGEMAAIFAGEERVALAVAPYANDVSIAAINGPENVVITGVRKSVRKILENLASEGVKAVQLKLSHAFHSPLIESMLIPFEEIASEVKYSAPRIGLISNVTGRSVEKNEVCEASYWRRHVREPIRFASGMKALHKQGYELFLEIGPNPVLLGMGRRCLPKGTGIWLPSLRKGRDDWKQMLESLGELYVRGVDGDWAGFDQDYSRRRMSLPTYPFERKRYWISPRSVDSGQWSIATDNGQRTADNKQMWNSLIEAGRIQAQQGISELNLDEYSANGGSLKRLYASYAGLALQSLQAFNHPEDRYSVETLMQQFSILPRYRQLLPRLLEALVEEGLLQRDAEIYGNLLPIQIDVINGLIENAKAITLFSENPKVIEFIQHCGENLGNVLVGKQDPMEVVFPDGSFNMVESLYKDNPQSRYYNLILREIVQKIVQSLPLDRRLRIVEIGAGTGATTASLLPVLPPDRTTYIFTDVSPIFLHRAQEKFIAYPFIQYKLLDIQQHPGDQGFKIHDYDVVIAASVLHATRDLNETLDNVRSLLAPGGLLLIREITQPLPMFDITFGPLLTELEDEELRKGQPFLSREKWDDFLRIHDFLEVEAFPEAGSEAEVMGEHVIVARASSFAALPAPQSFTVSAGTETDYQLNYGLHESGVQTLESGGWIWKATRHPLLGNQVRSAIPMFESRWNHDILPYLKQHKVFGLVVVAGSVFFEMACAAAEHFFETESVILDNATIYEPMILKEKDGSKVVQLTITPESFGEGSLQIFSIAEGERDNAMTWIRHMSCHVRIARPEDASAIKYFSVDDLRKRYREEFSVTKFHDILLERGLQVYKGLVNLWRKDGEAMGEIQLPEALHSQAGSYRIHPVMLDSCLQIMAAAIPADKEDQRSRRTYMPIGAERIRFYKNIHERVWCHAILRADKMTDMETLVVDYHFFDRTGHTLGEVVGMQVKLATPKVFLQMAKDISSEYFYEVWWKPREIQGQLQELRQIRPNHPGSWVIFADKGGVGQSLAKLLEEFDESCVMVFAGKELVVSEGEPCRINPTNHEDFMQLFQQRLGDHTPPLRGVVHLWSLDAAPVGETTVGSLKAAQLLGCGSVLHLVQAMTSIRWQESPRLCMVTRGAQPVGSEFTHLSMEQAPLWGLGKVIAIEHPELKSLLIDLDSSGDAHEVQSILRHLWSGDNESYIAFRNEVQYVPRIIRNFSKLSSIAAPTNFHSDATYIITGGLGGLGLEVSRWMVEHGVCHLALIGRKGTSEFAKEFLSKLEKMGAQIMVIRADVTDQRQIADAFGEIRKCMPPLRGIIHAAGVLDDGILLEQDWERFVKVMAPKMEGAWNLHVLTQDLPLDFFVLFSSMASILGSAGQGNHAAANAFLDVLAYHRRAKNFPALSINWGAWSKVGAVAQRGIENRIKMKGIEAIEPQMGLEILGRLLSHNAAQIGVMAVNWGKLLQQSTAWSEAPIFSEIAQKVRLPGKDDITSPKRAFLHQLEELPLSQREEKLEQYLKKELAKMLHLEDEEIQMDKDLLQFGLDSLALLELFNVVLQDLNVKIVLHEAFQDLTVRSLARRLANKISSKIDTESLDIVDALGDLIVPDPEHEYEPFDLTPTQYAYWVGSRSGGFELGNAACHTYMEVEMDEVDLERLNIALSRLIERHGMLRAIFLPDGRQQILEQVPPYKIEILDLRGQDPVVSASQLEAIRQRMSLQMLSVAQSPLFEIRASILNNQRIRLHIDFDLLIGDGWSFMVFARDLYQLYMNPEASLPTLDLSFRDYVLADGRLRDTDLYQRSMDYWRDRLSTLPIAPELPLAKEPGMIKFPQFVRRTARLEQETWLRLKTRAARAGLTPSGVLLAAFSEILAAWSKSPRFSIMLTLFNRPNLHPQINDIIGDFTLLSLLSVDNSSQDSFEVRARRIQKQLWKDLEHRYVSGVQVLRELGRAQEGGSIVTIPVVFTTAFYMGSASGTATVDLTGLPPLDMIYSISQTPQVWLDHQVFEIDGVLLFNWDAVEGLFPEGLLDDMFDAYCRFLHRLTHEENAWQETTRQLIPAAQLEKRAAVNATDAPISSSSEMLHTLFAAQVSKQPDHLAVISSNRTLSYEELSNRSNQVGHLLREKGVQPNTLVAVVMEKGWEQVVSVLGILQSGAAYLPIDPELPRERLWHLLENGEVSLVLTQSWLEERLEWPENLQRFSVDKMDLTDKDARPLAPVQKPEDLAYVIYTSGSTGLPKGVMIDHRGAVNTILDVNKRFGIGPEDRVVALSNLNFDLSVYDIFGTLAAGGTIVLPEADKTKDPAHWLELMMQEQVTVWNSVPALMQMLVEYASGRTEVVPQSLRLVLLSGDWIPLSLPDRIRAYAQNINFISLGGATEASIWSIYYSVENVKPGWKSIPYGTPLGNQRVYVLNEFLGLCPDWVTGNIYIGGTGLAVGYFKDENKTAESFIIHPETGERLYRTGDQGRYFPDGTIEFMGREDFQVKIAGHRIELGEIEVALRSHPDINDAVVIAIGEDMEHKTLAGYIIFDNDSGNQMYDIRSYLGKKLPQYMVPSVFVELETFPVTSNGKIDRKKLPEISAGGVSVEKEFTGPRNEIEELISGIWKKLLNTDSISIYDNFLYIGGDSLLAIRFSTEIRRITNVEIPIRSLIENPTIAGLAEILQKLEEKSGISETLPEIIPDKENRFEPFPLNDIQYAYWIGRQGGAFELGNVATYFYFEIEKRSLDVGKLNYAWNRLIKRHEMLRAIIHPDGKQQIFAEVSEYDFIKTDLSGKSDEELAEFLAKIRKEMSHRIFSSDKWPMFDIRVTKYAENERLHISFDALIADAWSIFKLLGEWFSLYENPEIQLKSIDLSFRDYVLAEKKLLNTHSYRRDRKYWKERIDEFPGAPELPLSTDPSMLVKPRFKRVESILPKDAWSRLKTYKKEAGLTPTMILLTAYAEILGMWSKSKRFGLNLTLFNRQPLHQEIYDIIGDFTSVNLLCVDLSEEMSFDKRARKIQEQLWQDLDHRLYSGIRVLQDLAERENSPGRAFMPVVFTSALGVGPDESDASILNNFGRIVFGISQTPQVWLDHQVTERNEELFFNWDYVDGLFPGRLIEEMFAAYCKMLERLAAGYDYGTGVNNHAELMPAGQLEMRKSLNSTEGPLSEELLHTLFEKSAEKYPDKTAVISVDMRMSYMELFMRSSSVANMLQRGGNLPGKLVAVIMKKGWEQVVSVLGILRAGAAYIPIDPDLPEERIKYLLKNSEVSCVLTQSLLDAELNLPGELIKIFVDMVEPERATPEAVNVPEDPAYIIYTSGSTGMPKGVMIDHRGAVNTILDVNRRFGANSDDSLLALSNLSFDLSVYDIFGILASGGTIVIPEAGKSRVPEHWIRLIEKEKVTIWNSAPALLRLLCDYAMPEEHRLKSLRLALLSGDWVPVNLPDKIRALAGTIDVISLGGATEASIWSIYYPVEKVDTEWKSIPYGKPLTNQHMYVLNELMEECPDWVTGDIYIGGVGLAKGYFRDEEKTTESFRIHKGTGERLYRTGDLGRYLPDGTIEFLGRDDFQVKISGHRIELGEIEYALCSNPKISEAVVTAVGDLRNDKRLIGYVVPAGEAVPEDDINDFLKAKLPNYMVPGVFVNIDEMPLTGNGKVNRKKLPVPGQDMGCGEIGFTAPSTETEIEIAEVWKDILGIEQLSIYDTFFNLGGNSFMLVQLINRLNNRFGLNLSLRSIFEASDISSIANYISSQKNLTKQDKMEEYAI